MQDDQAATDPASGFIRSRVVQLHPTLRCNLACSHCYSSSGPARHSDLAPHELIEKLALLRQEGFDVVSFSGGEPLVYRHFDEVLTQAKALGFRVNMITNGLLLNDARLENLRGVISRIGVSIDGTPEVHDSYRGRGSFDRTKKALSSLQDSGIEFGIAHCVTRASIKDLPWMLEFCTEQAASLLQLHPLVNFGRATEECEDQALAREDRARLFLLAEVLKVQAEDQLQIQLDLVPTEQLLANRSSYGVLRNKRDRGENSSLSNLVNPVILDEEGALWPLAYGMHRKQRIAAGRDEVWRTELDSYVASHAIPLHNLLTKAFLGLDKMGHQFIDWYAYLVELSHSNRYQTESDL